MDRIGFKVRIIAPYFKRIPPEFEENWVKKTKKARKKAYRGIKGAIKTRKDFKEKIAKPVEKTIDSFFDKKFVSESGRTHKNITDKTRKSMIRAGKDYPQRIKKAYQPGKYEEDIEFGRKEYARQWLRITGPLQGYAKDNIKGLSALGVMAICGDPQLKNFLKKGIDEIEPIRYTQGKGTPCRAVTEKPRGFKQLLANRIARWGSWIIQLGYEEDIIKEVNEKLNQLVNGYLPAGRHGRRSEIAPFSPAGASHIDFIWVEMLDPARPGRWMKWLGLDIQVTQR